MIEDGKRVTNRSRRSLLGHGLAVATALALPAGAAAKSIHPHKMRFHLEGVVDLAWVHSLYLPPVLAAGLPPGLAARLRIDYPSREAARFRGRRVALVDIFLAPADVPADQPAPSVAPISVLEIAVDETLLLVAAFGDPPTRPKLNVAIVGHIVSNEVDSPFGPLVHRGATLSFGFEWVDESTDAATFKLVATGAAGSHFTVLPHAVGEVAFL